MLEMERQPPTLHRCSLPSALLHANHVVRVLNSAESWVIAAPAYKFVREHKCIITWPKNAENLPNCQIGRRVFLCLPVFLPLMSATRSGLQKEVLSLYRRFCFLFPMWRNLLAYIVICCRALRIPRTKPDRTRAKWDLMIRYTFRKQAASAPPRAVSAIEHLLRAGTRQVSAFEDSSVKDCWVSAEMREWDEVQKQRRRRD